MEDITFSFGIILFAILNVWYFITINFKFIRKDKLKILIENHDAMALTEHEQSDERHSVDVLWNAEIRDFYNSIRKNYNCEDIKQWKACWQEVVDRFPDQVHQIRHLSEVCFSENISEKFLNMSSFK